MSRRPLFFDLSGEVSRLKGIEPESLTHERHHEYAETARRQLEVQERQLARQEEARNRLQPVVIEGEPIQPPLAMQSR